MAFKKQIAVSVCGEAGFRNTKYKYKNTKPSPSAICPN
jgi:hypothetical protein